MTCNSLKWPKYGLVLESHGHNYAHRIECFESFGWRGVCVFPSLSPSFCPMLHDAPCFIAGDDLVQECSVGWFIPNQMLWASTHTHLFMMFTYLLWNPMCGHVPVTRNVMTNFMHTWWQNIDISHIFIYNNIPAF